MAAESGYSPEAAVAMLLFSIASSSLLLINKLCMHYFPIPAIISTLQFVCASTTAVVSPQAAKLIAHAQILHAYSSLLLAQPLVLLLLLLQPFRLTFRC